MRRAALIGLGTLAVSADDYVKVINGRCVEAEGIVPLGDEGLNWTEDMDEASRQWCDGRDWCVGYMRYVGDNEVHCHAWCGRPQFCEGIKLTADSLWASYIRQSKLEAVSSRTWEAVEPAPAPAPYQVECAWPYSGLTTLWFEEPPPEDLEAVQAAAGDDHCQVLHHRRGQPPPLALESRRTPGTEDEAPRLHGVLSEDQQVMRYYAADVSAEPWVYSFDSNEYIGYTVNSGNMFGPKVDYLSFFFFSPSSACDGKRPAQWSPIEVEALMPGHVYVDDGTPETRRDAFNPYHFTVICANANESGFVPQAVVDALGFATHPLVHKDVHRIMHKAFFHLPDAVQPVGRIHPLMLEQFVYNMYHDEKKNEAMYFKQTFLFLMQELFRYRYRQGFQTRLEIAACGLCEERRRLRRLADAAEDRGAGDRRSVGVLFCIMSRRVGHVLRGAIRETWGTRVTRDATTALRFFVGSVAEGASDKDGSATPKSTAIVDAEFGDVIELPAPEAYKAVTLKAFSMLDWAHQAFPNLRFLVRSDDDVYLRPSPLLARLEQRPPVSYLWGNFDHGSNPVRNKTHPHYNSEEQFPARTHPLFGDIFPPYARGHLWAMSADLLAHVTDVWHGELMRHDNLSLTVADRLPHPDDPALGVALNNLVEFDKLSINFDDRDLNTFALNPACNATYLNIHNRTWVVHHVDAEAMRCMWAIDSEAGDCMDTDQGCSGILPDLCSCSIYDAVVEEEDDDPEPFDYPRTRFND